MNPIYEEMKQKNETEVADAVDKFIDAVNAFQKLNPNQKERFFQNVVLQKYLSDVLDDGQSCFSRIYRNYDSQKM